MIATGRRHDARRRNLASQQIGKGATRFERAGVLQQFELETQALDIKIEICTIDFDHRCPTNIGSDQAIGGFYPSSIDHWFVRLRPPKAVGSKSRVHQKSETQALSDSGRTAQRSPVQL